MHEHTDFGQLYDALGIRPGCSIVELRAAYRRLAAQLHPDAGGQADDVARLQQINRIYHSATQFHRMHGRLPGETVACVAAGDGDGTDGCGTGTDADDKMAVNAPHARPALAVPRRRMRSLMLGGVVIALLAWITTFPDDASQRLAGSQDNYRKEPATGRLTTLGQDTQRVAIGMASARVLAVSGEPLSRHEVRWDYGPSWIAFECGVVSDWYSSPLRPIHSGPASPGERDQVHTQTGCRTTGD